jgi:hypothetical protein
MDGPREEGDRHAEARPGVTRAEFPDVAPSVPTATQLGSSRSYESVLLLDYYWRKSLRGAQNVDALRHCRPPPFVHGVSLPQRLTRLVQFFQNRATLDSGEVALPRYATSTPHNEWTGSGEQVTSPDLTEVRYSLGEECGNASQSIRRAQQLNSVLPKTNSNLPHARH